MARESNTLTINGYVYQIAYLISALVLFNRNLDLNIANILSSFSSELLGLPKKSWPLTVKKYPKYILSQTRPQKPSINDSSVCFQLLFSHYYCHRSLYKFVSLFYFQPTTVNCTVLGLLELRRIVSLTSVLFKAIFAQKLIKSSPWLFFKSKKVNAFLGFDSSYKSNTLIAVYGN